MGARGEESQPVAAQLGLWDAVSIIIGIIIGATIFETPPLIYSNVSNIETALGIWVLGGFISLIGAFCYAELATTYPHSGGDYVYLSRAYGSWMGFLFGWVQLTIIHTGAIGMLCYIFADYTHRLCWGKTAEGRNWTFLFAALAAAILTAINVLGVVLGKRTQNLLTGAKVVGLLGIVTAGLFWPQVSRHYFQGKVVRVDRQQMVLVDGEKKERTFTVLEGVPILGLREKSKLPALSAEKKSHEPADLPAEIAVTVTVKADNPQKAIRIEEWSPPGALSFGFAMVLVMLAFSGYNDAAYVAAEVRNQRRNMPRALILGVTVVTIFYLLVNASYLFGLGFEEARKSDAIAADVFGLFLGETGEKAMCLLVMISALGGINGSILTGSRIFASLGKDHYPFAWLGRWDPRVASPVWSLAAQGLICLVMIVLVGNSAGQGLLDQLFSSVGLKKLSWEGRSGFETLLKFTTPIFWLFFLLTSLSLFVLRKKDRDIERPFAMPLYPLLPLIFTGSCAYMLYSGLNYAGELGLVGAVLLLVGLLLYLVSPKRGAESLPVETGPT